ncbi:U3 small nucleolar RNA-associated protein 15 homolog [Teleopsis dalmanni]|uniref:U3 small nucleolar RNA-associated protein 15 homolog n=1 Tax=Teleopsis dalmanni TaxID=139649 RepID=UPI0018CF8EBB|nr:U3 small nucleolar RNA-associated protein 15 homolog [Teleopsis dalmanni]
MSNFKPLFTKKYDRTSNVDTPDSLYWKRLGVPTLVKEFGAIDYIDFRPNEPHFFAVTCSVRVQIYNPFTKLVVRNLSRFQENAYGGTFRQDGRLLAAGDQEGHVKLFDPSSKNVLRLFKAHTAPVHRVNFTSDLLNIISCSDDKTVRQWDIGAEKLIHTFTEHEDYVRAGAVNPMSPDIFISGGYDGKVKMYDARSKYISLEVDHGSPVESLLFIPTGSIFISAGSTEVRVWDALSGGRLLSVLSQHHKTVTCLRLGSNGKRVLSGGLDKHVKIYDVGTYETVHTIDFPNAVLSLGVAPNDQSIVTGMVDGMVSIQNMDTPTSENIHSTVRSHKQKMNSKKGDHEIAQYTRPVLLSYDNFLRKYEYGNCLDAVLKKSIVNKTPEVTVSIMQELIHRKGLERALAGRTHSSLYKILRFLCRYIGEHRFSRVLIDVSNILLDAYAESYHGFTDDLCKQFNHLANIVQAEVDLTYEMLEFQGALEMLVLASSVEKSSENIHFVTDSKLSILQSVKAKEASILNV